MRKTVLITGASSGIGAATALSLASTWDVVLVARRRERLQSVAEQITAAGGKTWVISSDLTVPAEPQRVIAQAVALAGGLDALVNNAGIFTTSTVDAVTAEHIAALWQLNVQVPMVLSAAAIPHLAARRGSIRQAGGRASR